LWLQRAPAQRLVNDADGLIAALSRDDVAALGPALLAVPDDVLSGVRLSVSALPEDFPRAAVRLRMLGVLDVAVGSGAKEAVKYLVSFRGLTPDGDAMALAVGRGDPELIKMVWDRLPADAMSPSAFVQTAAQFCRLDALRWLVTLGVEDVRALVIFAAGEHLAGTLHVLAELGIDFAKLGENVALAFANWSSVCALELLPPLPCEIWMLLTFGVKSDDARQVLRSCSKHLTDDVVEGALAASASVPALIAHLAAWFRDG
jgi:hypothetical protein